MQSENLGMVTHAPRVLSYAFLTTFILSECHHRSLLYLKKALTDMLFRSKRSIGRFSVHGWCVILASNSDLRTTKTIYTIENDIFLRPKLFNKENKNKQNTLTRLSMSKNLLHRWQNTHRHQGHRKHKDLSTIEINRKGYMYFRSHPVKMPSSKRTKWSSPNFLYWITHETNGGGVKFGSLERESVRWPQIFILFSERYYNSQWIKNKFSRFSISDFLIHDLF